MNSPMTPAPGGGGPGTAPLAAPPAKIRPGRIWYLVALLAVLGGVAWLVFGFVSITSHINSFPRVAVPAGGQVSLDHPGGYVVYYEGPGAESGQVPAFQVRVIPVSASAAVRSLAAYNSTLTYGIGSHQGRAVLTLQISQPGQFRVQTPGAASLPAGADLAFGDSFAGGLVGTLVPGLLLTFAGLAGLVVIFIIRVVKTNRARAPVPAWSPPAGPPPTQTPPMQPPPS